MATGTVMPVPKMQFFDDTGVPLANGKLYAYAAGTSTPQDTFTDSTLSVANANPVVLDSAGRAAVFLSALSYKFVLKTSADVTVWTVDAVQSVALVSAVTENNQICDGRITLTSGTPVTASDVTAATTVYFTPYRGNRIALYNGTAWSVYTFSELSLSLGSDTADKNYDLFAYANNGAVAIERLAWTSDSARATGLALQDGVYVKSGTTTRRYLGTYRTTSVAGQCEDSDAKRFVWNYANRIRRSLRKLETTASWTYTTNSGNEANNSMANAVAVVVGLAEALLDLTAVHVASNTNTGVTVATGISEDITTAIDPKTPATGSIQGAANTALANANVTLVATLRKYPTAGYHLYVWFEYSAATGTTTWLGVSTNIAQTGLSGSIEG